MEAINCLALFDGVSCGMVAFERAGIPVNRYVAYEIEPTAIAISKKNYPQIEQCGDVTTADFTQYKGFDIITAGFPCQDLSINKADREGLKGSRSGLFWEAVRAIEEVKPKYFLIENNYKMPQEDCDTITRTLGVEPILIDSSTVSGQQRKRLYWTNIECVEQPDRKQINVVDIIEGRTAENLINEVVFNGKEKLASRHDKPLRIGTIGKGGQGERVYSIFGKSVTLTANGGGRGAKTGLYLINGTVRKLTPLEAERLQTLPDNYTKVDGISDTSRLKAIGNGWTVDVIAHIFTYLKKGKDTVKLGFPIPEERANLNDVSNSLFALDRDENTQILVEVSKGETEVDGERIAEYEFDLKDNTVHVMVHNGEVINFVRKEEKPCGK